MKNLSRSLVSLTLLPGLAGLAGCARHPLSEERRGEIPHLSAASFLGDELALDLSPRSLSFGPGERLDVAAWRLDETLRSLLEAGARERGKEWKDLALEPSALGRALGIRESRWKKVVGRQSQALMELLFREATRQGIRYFFLISPTERPEASASHRGTMGVLCPSAEKGARAYPYFAFDFSLWDVARRKKAFHRTVAPAVTEALTLGDCAEVARLSEPARQLEDPVKKALELVVDALFDKMGWKRVLPGPAAKD